MRFGLSYCRVSFACLVMFIIDASPSNPTLNSGWDSDMSTLLLLLHILSPQSTGRKRTYKISTSRAMDNLVVFHKVCDICVHSVVPEISHGVWFLCTVLYLKFHKVCDLCTQFCPWKEMYYISTWSWCIFSFFFFSVTSSHARALMSTLMQMTVDSHICLLQDSTRKPSATTTSSWIRS